MKRILLIFLPLLGLLILTVVTARSPMPPVAPVAPVAVKPELKPSVKKVPPKIAVPSSAEDERLRQLKSDQFRMKKAASESREEHYRKVADIMNGDSLKVPMVAKFKEWGLDELTLQKTLDVLYNRDMSYLHEVQRRELETPSEVGDRTDKDKVQASKDKHSAKNEAVTTTANVELLAILGSPDRVREVNRIKLQVQSDYLAKSAREVDE